MFEHMSAEELIKTAVHLGTGAPASLAIIDVAVCWLCSSGLSNSNQLTSQHCLIFQKEDPGQRAQGSCLKLTEQSTTKGQVIPGNTASGNVFFKTFHVFTLTLS